MAQVAIRILGIDPGLQRTGWGIIETAGSQLGFIAAGTVSSSARAGLAERLCEIHDGLALLIEAHRPVEAAVEATFVSHDGAATLKLGQARGVALLAPARAGVPVAEYAANAIKKAVVGVGHADKGQMQAMVQRLLPGVKLAGADAADALAVAICHAHHSATQQRWQALGAMAPVLDGRPPAGTRAGPAQ
jgi:crossover junction endodeoxyribonuclease RuvC